MVKQVLAIFVGTIAGQLIWDYVIKPKMDEKDKNKKDK